MRVTPVGGFLFSLSEPSWPQPEPTVQTSTNPFKDLCLATLRYRPVPHGYRPRRTITQKVPRLAAPQSVWNIPDGHPQTFQIVSKRPKLAAVQGRPVALKGGVWRSVEVPHPPICPSTCFVFGHYKSSTAISRLLAYPSHWCVKSPEPAHRVFSSFCSMSSCHKGVFLLFVQCLHVTNSASK